MEKIAEWGIQSDEGEENVWLIQKDQDKVVVSNLTHRCWVASYSLDSDWEDRLEATVYYYMRGQVNYKKYYSAGNFKVVEVLSREEWFQSPSYQRLMERIKG